MTIEQALEVLKQIAALAPINLQGHMQAAQAYDILKKAIEKKE